MDHKNMSKKKNSLILLSATIVKEAEVNPSIIKNNPRDQQL